MKGLDLRNLRIKKNWSQEHLANLIGVTKRTIITWEKSEKISLTNSKLLESIFNPTGNDSSNKPQEIKLNKDGIEFSENEVVSWIHDNFDHLKTNNKYMSLLIDKEVENRLKLRLEELGFKIKLVKN